MGSKSDASLFIHITNVARLYLLAYVDDIIIIESATQEISEFVEQLHS